MHIYICLAAESHTGNSSHFAALWKQSVSKMYVCVHTNTYQLAECCRVFHIIWLFSYHAYFCVCVTKCGYMLVCMCVCLQPCSCTDCRMTFNYLNHSAKWLHINKLQAVNMCCYLWLRAVWHIHISYICMVYMYVYSFIYINIYKIYIQLYFGFIRLLGVTNYMNMQKSW